VKKNPEKALALKGKEKVPRIGIEPMTRGFSVGGYILHITPLSVIFPLTFLKA
jgi:hypothetical protein